MTHRERVDALVQSFVSTSAEAQLWQRYATLDPAERATLTAGGDARLARDFAVFAASRGAPVRIVHATGGQRPGHEDATWVRVLNIEGIHGYDVDLAAARFGDPALPCPLVWAMDGRHPFTGTHRSVRGTPVTAVDPE